MVIISRLLRNLPAPGIRTKLTLIILTVIVILTVGTLFFIQASLNSAMGEQLDQKGLSTINNLTARSREPILTDNIFKLYQLAYDTVETNEDIIYVFYQDGNGNVVIHTFDDYFPRDLLEIEHSFGENQQSLKKFTTEEGILRELAAPVFEGAEPEIVVRLGIIDYSIQSAMAAATRQLLLVAAATFAVISTLVYFLATQTTIKPLNSLLKSVQAVSRGNLSQHVKVKSKDELHTLADAFNTMTQHLKETRQSRDLLMKQIITSQEEERQRIARELHDETGQSISSLMIYLHFLKTSANKEEFQQKSEEFREQLTQTLQQVRLMSWKLSPTPLSNLGLEEALQSFVKKYEETTEWNIKLNTEGLRKISLPDEAEINLYRVVQEALTNIARHARAKNVRIDFTVENDSLVATIEDDGVGFDTSKQGYNSSTSLGINTMNERISMIGGSMETKSSPGKGTRIEICIELNSQDLQGGE